MDQKEKPNLSKAPNSKACILLVDDDSDWRLVMRDVLSAVYEHGEVREVCGKQSALEYLSAASAAGRLDSRTTDTPWPDLIYLDIEMPDGSGQEVLKTIKADPDLKDIPVFMLTGVNDPGEEALAKRNGASGYIVKQADPMELVQTVTSTMERCIQGPDDLAELIFSQDDGRALNPKILIVEDDADQRELVREVLIAHFEDSEASNIVAVSTGDEALKQNLDQFDIVMLDYNLPDVSGLNLLERILSRADLPIIFVTGENVSSVAVEAIRKGAQDYVIKLGDYLFTLPVVVDKNIRQHQMKKENERLQARLKLKNLQLEESLKKMRSMAETDHLTGLSNRRRFGELLEQCYSQAIRYDYDLTCCMCDMDHFKRLNDTLGHQLGDKALILASEIVRSSVRSSDIAARYGGDEFVILLPHTSVERGLAVIDRMRNDLLQRNSDFGQLTHPITMSVGVASLDADHPASGEELVSMADRALYLAKDRGRDMVVAYNKVRLLIEHAITPA